MNKDNVQKAINVMRRVVKRKKAFNMENWQEAEVPKKTELALTRCGSAACFGGWLAVSPEWVRAGGECHPDYGYPILGHYYRSNAIAKWLGISQELADALTAVDCRTVLYDVKSVDQITAQHVLDRLIELRDTGKCIVIKELR